MGTPSRSNAPSLDPKQSRPARITWLGHASVRIDLGSTRLLADPVLGRFVGPLVRTAPVVTQEQVADIDAVLLSHLHADHADLPSLRMIGSDAIVFAPEGAGRWLRRHGMTNVEELPVGSSASLGGVDITATTAHHDGRRVPFGPTAATIGFVVRANRSIYFAGDTDLFDEMRRLEAIDVALLPVSGWGRSLGPGHMDPGRAAHAAAMIAPRQAIPIHWGTLAPPHLLLRRRNRGKIAAERFEALARTAAPSVHVCVLRPGEAIVV